MDKALISRRFAKAVGTYLDKADVQRYVASRMAELTGRYIPSAVHKAASSWCKSSTSR